MTYHVPVMADEIVSFFQDAPVGPIVDGTLGGGGHTRAILDSAPQRQVIGIDRDPEALEETARRIDDPRLETVQGNFGDLLELLADLGMGSHSVAGILLDLGVSSHQLDAPARGFGFKHNDAPLDMRMDGRGDGPTARELLESLDAEELARILREYGEVRGAKRLALSIKEELASGALSTTADLARLVDRVQKTPAHLRRRVHPATTVFQALRIAVNRELEALDRALADAPEALMPGGRMAVISYHSLEDRRVKQAFRRGQDGPERPGHLPPPSDWRATWKVLTRKPVSASQLEIEDNPRARSARLRVAERESLAPGRRP